MSSVKAEPRLVARVSPDIHQLVNEAASLSGTTMTQFLISAVTEKATKIIEDMTVIRLTQEDSRTVFDALENPGEPNKSLKQLWQQYKGSGLYDIEDRTDK